MSNIPVLTVRGKNAPEAWEKAVIGVWKMGIDISTEYDKDGDPPSKDCTMIMIVEDPLSEPRIHRAMPGGLEDLEIYRQEVINGIHDDRINPEEGKWAYTYHQRLFAYPIRETSTQFNIDCIRTVDQIDYIVRTLSNVPYSRRAQAVTWDVELDSYSKDPPCLIRVWCRIADGDILHMNTHWRSRDAYKAAFMNMFVMVDLQRVIAQRISERTGRKIKVGQYVDISDSFHIYGSYYREIEGFLKNIKNRTFPERTWDMKFAKPMFEEAREKLRRKYG